MTTVINIKKMPNFVDTPDYVYIGRGSIYGNPFSWLPQCANLIQVSSREEALTNYHKWISGELILNDWTTPPTIEQILALKGKTLGCYCRPEACHGDVLKEIIQEHDLLDFFSEDEATEIDI